ncbi:hypothetical protein C8J57DRAFT_1367439 [Mycena rebaudengoi]|nr:hypothetical protein C8J57DRAFT_1367439 [Mycena rebaudengoi]
MGSHQTHRLQPCDVGAFGPSKTFWRTRCDEVLLATKDTIPTGDIVKEWMDVRSKAFRPDTIKQAWAKSGINLDASGLFPRLTPEIFTAADYAPSMSTSTQLHLPLGFPTAPSDSDDASPSPSASSSSASASSLRSAASVHTVVDVEQPPADLVGEGLIQFYQTLARKFAAQRDAAQAEAAAAEAHAVLAGSHIQSLQAQLNAKGKKKRAGTDRNLPCTARMLTSAEGREIAAERQRVQLEKKAKDEENLTQRLLADAGVITRRTELGRHGMEFTAKIKVLKAPELKDLAWSLELDETGTREVLIDRTLDHFGAPQNEHLKQDKRYADLWRVGCRRRGPVVSTDDSEHAPMDGVLVSVDNVVSGSGPSTSQVCTPPPPLPDAPYTFQDSWMPPQRDISYEHPIDHPPPFMPQFYAYPQPPHVQYPTHPHFHS